MYLFHVANQRFLQGQKGRYRSTSTELTWLSAPLFLLQFVIFGVFGVYSYQHDQERARNIEQLASSGIEITGRVRSCTESRGRVSIAYEYSVVNSAGVEQRYSSRDSLEVSSCRAFTDNTPIRILYLLEHHDISKLADSSGLIGVPPTWLILAAFGFGFSIVGWGSIFGNEWRFWRLGRSGSLSDGEIIAAEAHVRQKQYVIEAQYRFRLPDGREFEGTERSVASAAPLEAPPAGTKIWVLYCSPRLYRAL